MCVVRAMAKGAAYSNTTFFMASLIFLHYVLFLNFLDLSMVGNLALCNTQFCQALCRTPNMDIFQSHRYVDPCLRLSKAEKVSDADQQCKDNNPASLPKLEVSARTHAKNSCASLSSCHTTCTLATAALCQVAAVTQHGRSKCLPAMQKQEQLGLGLLLPSTNLGMHQLALSSQTPYAQVSRRNMTGCASNLYQTQDGNASGHRRPSDKLLQPLSDMMKEIKDDQIKGKATNQVTEHSAPCAHEAKAQRTQSPGDGPSRHQHALNCSNTPRPENKMPPFQGVVVNLANIWRHDGARFIPSGRGHAEHKQCPHFLAQANHLGVWSLDRMAMTPAAQAITSNSTRHCTMQSPRMQLLHLPALLVLCTVWAVLCWAEWATRPLITHARFTCRLCRGTYRRRPKVLLSESLISATRRWLYKLGEVSSFKFTFGHPEEADCISSSSRIGKSVRSDPPASPQQCVCKWQVTNSTSTSRRWTKEVRELRKYDVAKRAAQDDFQESSGEVIVSSVRQLTKSQCTSVLSVVKQASLLQPFSGTKDGQHKAPPLRSKSHNMAKSQACCHQLHWQATQLQHSMAKSTTGCLARNNSSPPQHPFPGDRQGTPRASLRSSMGHTCRAEQTILQYVNPLKNSARVGICTSITSLWRSTLGFQPDNHRNYGSQHQVSTAEAGRKSGQGCINRALRLHAVFVLFILLQCITKVTATLEPSIGGSADLRPPECPPYEASRHTQQNGAERNGQSATTGNRQITRPVRKRAFIRAQNRAARHGEAIYRGRRMTATQMGVQPLNNATPKRDHRSTSCPKNAFRYLSWNAGGLTMEKYQELKHWLNTNEAASFHLICIQETQWSSDSEYEFGNWSVIHSGSGSRSGGLLCIIHRSLAAPAQIKSQAPIPGRLLHIRLTTEPAIDLLIVYQHSWLDNQASRDKLLSQRADIWAKISGWIAAVPRRNLCCIMGDFNTEVRHDGRCIGRGTMSQREPRQRDWHMWSDMTKTHDLCLLNTWGKQGTHAHMYRPMDGGAPRLTSLPSGKSICSHGARQYSPSIFRLQMSMA